MSCDYARVRTQDISISISSEVRERPNKVAAAVTTNNSTKHQDVQIREQG